MGKITCANVLSDLYAMGVAHCDNMLMLLGVSDKLTEEQRDAAVPLIMEGFKDLASQAGTCVNGGQTVVNPWMTIGGVATAVCRSTDFIMPEGAEPGDVLVLTKPLGTQVAVNAHQWLLQPERWNKIKDVVTVDDVTRGYHHAMKSMSRLNKTGAQLMHKFKARGATDVTGFGILGHAQNLVSAQKKEVNFVIHTLPIIEKMSVIAKTCGIMFKLLQGYSAETSGGLLVILPATHAESFCKELHELDGAPAWIVGRVEEGNRKAEIVPEPTVLEVPLHAEI